jgi:hypothetical protein
MCLFYVGGNYNKIQYNTTVRQYNNEDSLNSTVIYINYLEFSYSSHDLVQNRPHFRRNFCHQSTRQDMRFLFVVLRCRYLITLHGVLGKLHHSRSSLSSSLTTSFIPFLILLSVFSLFLTFLFIYSSCQFSLSFFVCFVLTRYILLKRQKFGLCL